MSVALHISGTIHANMVQMCKMIISSGVFFNVKILIFQVVKGLKCKECPKMLKISVCHTLCLRNHTSYDLHLWYTCMYKRIISPGILFIFFIFLLFKILIFRIIWDRPFQEIFDARVAKCTHKYC